MGNIFKINIDDINPYVRLVQKVSGTANDYYVPWRIIYDFEIMFITKGDFIVRTANDCQYLKAGDLIIIPPFLKHKQEIPDNCDCTYYAVHMDFYGSIGEEDFSCNDVYVKPCEAHYEAGLEVEELKDRHIYEPKDLDLSARVRIHNYNEMEDIFQKLLISFEKGKEVSKLEIRGYAILLVVAILNEIANQDDDANYAEKTAKTVADYVSRHFSEHVDFFKFAQQYGFTPNYFRKVFKQMTNSAPNEYLISLRIEESKKLLRLKRYTVETISEMVGYDDVHYFTRLFKKREGISPARYSKEFGIDSEPKK